MIIERFRAHLRLSLGVMLACFGLATGSAVEAGHASTLVYAEARGFGGTGNTLSAAGADVWFRNGDLVGTPLLVQSGGGTASWSAGPTLPDATAVWAATEGQAAGGSFFTFAAGSLDRAELKAVVGVAYNGVDSTSGGAQARFEDAIWFTNSTDSLLPVTLTMPVRGRVEGFQNASARVELFSHIGLVSGGGTSCNAQGQCITPNPDGTGATSFALYGDIDHQSTGLTFREQLGGTTNDDIPFWVFSFGPDHAPATGRYDYAKSLTLWVPGGETTLFVNGWLRITVCSLIGLCDFGNTAAIRFGALPAGLSFTSQSGRFLSDPLFDNGFE